jgi:pimeloyl-ACP methyl ester carboxylesterase
MSLRLLDLRPDARTLILLVSGLMLAGVACGRSHPPDPAHDVDIVATDGHVLKGSYFSPGQPGPAILLIHQCNMDRHAWDTLVPDLTAAGIHVLTFDQRSYGDTKGPADQEKTFADADAAYTFLKSKTGVDGSRTAAGGASCGVMYSSGLAARHPEIKTLVLMSGWADDKARAYFAATPSLAIFGAAADYRTDGADIRQAVAASKNPQSTAKIFPGSAHGVPLFDANPDLKPALILWLKRQLTSGNGQPSRL